MRTPLPARFRGAFLARGLFSLALASAGSAAAQDAGEPVAAHVTTGQLPSIVVTATRSEEHIDNLVADISVIDSDLDRRGLNLQEVLRVGGGVQLTANGGPGATSNVLIRGANGGHTLTLIEGFRVSSALLGQTTFETLPLAHTRRIEILRGPASALYGADALGGVVQLFAPTARPGLQASAEAAGGGEVTRQLKASLSGGSESLSAGILLNRDRSGGFNATTPGNFAFNPDRDGYRREGISAHADAKLATGTRLRGLVMQNRLDADYDDGDFPGARVRARLDLIGIKGTHDPDTLTQLTFRVGESTDRSDIRSSSPGSFTSRQLQYGVSGTRQLSAAARLQLLLERLEERGTSTSYESGAAAKRVTDSIGAILVGDHGPHLAQASVRLDDSDQFDSQTNYGLTYGYRLGGGVRIGAGYATGFHSPGFNDLYFPGYGRSVIRPERSHSAELGLYWNQPAQTGEEVGDAIGDAMGEATGDGAGGRAGGVARGKGGAWHAKAVLFQSRVRDLITYAAQCPDPAPEFAFGCASNVDRARIRGLSLAIGQQRLPAGPQDESGLGWYFNLDLLDPRDESTDNRLPRRAARQLTAGAEYGKGAVTLGADVVVASRRFDDAANLERLGGYAVLNLRVAYRFAPHLQGFATVSNAGDRDYATALDYAQQGRLVMVGVRYGNR